jgi:hypothetical protein
MARRYDSRTTIFSPEGRLYQVEYAMEAISNAGAAIGILSKEGVVLVAEKKITSKVGLIRISDLLGATRQVQLLTTIWSLPCSYWTPMQWACDARRCTSLTSTCAAQWQG